MQVRPISIDGKRANSTSFESRLTFDIGASDPRGSLKILVQDNNGEDLFEYKGFVNDTTEGFVDNDDFVSKIARAMDVEGLIKKDIETSEHILKGEPLVIDGFDRLKERLEKLKSNLKLLQQRSSEEKKLTGLALLVPGTVQEHNISFMPNIKDRSGKELSDVDLDKVIEKIKSNKAVELAEDFNVSKLYPCKDLAGTGIGIAQKLANHPIYGSLFKEGFYATAAQTGGGFGSVDIILRDNNVVDIETNESGHDIVHNPRTNREVRLGKMGASAKNIIENFATKLGVDDPGNIDALIKTGNAKIATLSNNLILNNQKDHDAIKVLIDTQAYEVTHRNNESSILKVKDKCFSKFQKASKEAIHAYAETLGIHAITKVNTKRRLYIVSGPLAMGLNESIQLNPELYEAANMRELILKFIDKHVGGDSTCIKQRKNYNFDVICDCDMSVDNNTRGGSILLSGKAHAINGTGDWRVPMKILKTLARV